MWIDHVRMQDYIQVRLQRLAYTIFGRNDRKEVWRPVASK